MPSTVLPHAKTSRKPPTPLEKKRTIVHLPRSVRTALGKKGLKPQSESVQEVDSFLLIVSAK
jgi:hypothetical protein